MERPISEERDTVFKDSTDAQDRCCPDNKYMVLWESVFDPIILEHYRPVMCRLPVHYYFIKDY
jgi:hypothetical protein